MTSRWPTKNLADVCKVFADGDWIETKDQSNNGVRLIQTGNVGEGAFKDREEKARYVSDATFRRLRCTEIYEGDCLISRLPDPVGRSCILPHIEQRTITAVDCTIVRFDLEQVIPEFFGFYSQSRDYLQAAEAQSTGTTRKRISRNRLGQIHIPVPPISEQRRMVNILDEAFNDIATAQANAEKNLQSASAVFESRLQAVFLHRGNDWVTRSLQQLGTTQTGATPKTYDGANFGSFIPFIKPSDFVRDGSLDYSREGLSEKGLASVRLVPAGSVLMVCIGATIGKCGVCDRDVATNQQINSLTPTKGTSHRFIYYQMLTADLKRRVLLNAAQATLPIISKSKWSALTLTLPPTLDEQERIAAQLDALVAEVQHLADIYRQKLTALNELKKSLLHHAFNGDL